jgi:hypothetical protein
MPLDFQPMTWEQANPVQTSISKMIEDQLRQEYARQTGIQNQYLPDQLRIANAIQQNTANYAPRMSEQELALKQAMPGYYNSLTRETDARTGLIGSQTNQAKYSDPTLKRLFEITQASQDPRMQTALQNAGLSPGQSAPGQYQKLPVAPGQTANLANKFGNTPLTIPIGQAPQNIPIEQQQVQQIPLSQSLLQHALQSNGMAPPSPQQQTSSQIGINPYTQAQQQIAANAGVTPNPITTPQAMGSQDAVNNFIQSGSPLGFAGLAAQKANQAGMTEFAKKQADEKQKLQNDAVAIGKQSDEADLYLEQFKENYDRAGNKGPYKGWLPALSGPEQLVDTAAKNLQVAFAKSAFPGRVTNVDVKLAGEIKPNRALAPEAANQLYMALKERGERHREYGEFIDTANQMGLTPGQATSLFSRYEKDFPTYDFKNKTAITNNRGKWNEYLTPEAIEAVRTGKKYTPPSLQNDQGNYSVKVRMPDGSSWSIDRSKLDEAKKRGAMETQ